MSETEDGAYVCEECGKKRATVHLTDIVGGKAVQRHLCDRCYAEKEGGAGMLPAAAVFAHILAAVAPELSELTLKQCPRCGMGYLEFRQSGQLGCPEDYQVFAKPLEALLEQVHGATRHCGKVPPQAGPEAARESRLRALHRQQDEAVEREDYELAARLRDRIRTLESQNDEPDESEG